MEDKITILAPFFEDPGNWIYIRELSRKLKINHTTIRQKLNKLVKEGFLVKQEMATTISYKIVLSQEYLNLKLYYNLSKLWKSNLISDLIKHFDFPVIVLFGSYANGTDDIKSDIDLCIISDSNKEFQVDKYKKYLNREVSIHHFTRKKWSEIVKDSPSFVNSVCNGIVLSGELEVLK